MVVLNRATAALTPAAIARAAVAGGADMVQVREKELDPEMLRSLVEEVIEATGGPWFVSVNSDLAIARELGANLHLPESNLPDQQMAVVPEPALVGRSIHSANRVPAAADYLMLGNLFETSSKPGTPGLGGHRFGTIARTFDLPVLAIGGIRPDNVAVALAAGASGVAVSSYVNSSDDPERAAREIRNRVDAWLI